MMFRSGASSARAGERRPTRRQATTTRTLEYPPVLHGAKVPKKDRRCRGGASQDRRCTSSTSISARKRPVTTDTPSARAWATSDSTSGSASSGWRRVVQLGRRPFRQSPSSVNCETTPSARPASAASGSSRPPRPGRRAGAPASRRVRPRRSRSSPRATPTSASRPAPISATVSPPTRTRARLTRCATALTASPGPRTGPGRPRLPSVRCSTIWQMRMPGWIASARARHVAHLEHLVVRDARLNEARAHVHGQAEPRDPAAPLDPARTDRAAGTGARG